MGCKESDQTNKKACSLLFPDTSYHSHDQEPICVQNCETLQSIFFYPIIRASWTARAKRVSSNGTQAHTFRIRYLSANFPMICSISKSLISVRVSMLIFFFERLCSRDNDIWMSSATYVFSYKAHATWLANRKHF